MAHVPRTQPLRPEAFATGAPEPLPAWLTDASAAPLVYVTFGTVFNADLTAVGTFVEALRDQPVRVVVTLGPSADPQALGPQPDNVHVALYIPQTQRLAHCSAVISHGGSGTFLAALARGLPQVCLPQAADQFLNAEACVGAGAGRALLPGTVTVERVRDEVDAVLADPALAPPPSASRRDRRHAAAARRGRGDSRVVTPQPVGSTTVLMRVHSSIE